MNKWSHTTENQQNNKLCTAEGKLKLMMPLLKQRKQVTVSDKVLLQNKMISVLVFIT